MTGLIFARLGYYALWGDEALTALEAKAVLETGDTSMVIDHGNIIAYRDALLIHDFCDRSTPPLSSYLTAASFSLLGVNSFSARLPFALLGLGTVALMLLWAYREKWPVLLVLAAALIGNVSLILFFRQCRYYAPAIFFSVAIAFVYWRWKPSPRNLLILSVLSVLLFVGDYMNYLALYFCMGVDWLIWRRNEWKPGWLGWLCFLGPQTVLIALVVRIWNPLKTHFGSYEGFNTVGDRLTLFFWYWRDMHRCEFFAIPVILLALAVGIVQYRDWLIRGCVAMAVYVAGLALVSPQIISHSVEGEVRYLAPLIPLALALQTGALCALLEGRRHLLIVAALVVFGTNLLNYWPTGSPGLHPWELRSTLLSYLGELGMPQTEPFTPTSQWINENVPEGASICVEPYYMIYPLMFHAPHALYAWQLSWPPRPDLAGLPRIHFIGQEPPDYVIGFGPAAGQFMQSLQAWKRPDVRYQAVKTIDAYWQDGYRPELYWRNFQTTTDFNSSTEAVYIFQRMAPSPNRAPVAPLPGTRPPQQPGGG